MIYGIIGVISLYSSRIFLEKKLGMSSMGVFGYFLVISLQINGFWSSFNKAWSPEVYSKLKTNESKKFIFDIMYFISFLYLLILSLASIIFNKFLWKLLLKQEYMSNINVLLILLLFPIFTSIYTVFYPLFYYKKNTTLIIFISAITMVINLTLLYSSINYFGIIGAAVGTVFGSAINLFLYILFFKKITEINFNFIVWLTTITLGVIVAIFLLLNFNHYYFEAIILILAIFTFIKGSLKNYCFLILSKLKNNNF